MSETPADVVWRAMFERLKKLLKMAVDKVEQMG